MAFRIGTEERIVADFVPVPAIAINRMLADGDQRAPDTDAVAQHLAGDAAGSHDFTPGEYVSIRDDDGELHTFRVVSVVDV